MSPIINRFFPLTFHFLLTPSSLFLNPSLPMTDPVCGMNAPEPPTLTCRYNGVTYGFCAEHCLTQFSRHPDYYLGGLHLKARQAAASAVFTCPMHPETRKNPKIPK